MRARDIYLSFFMFTVDLHPDDPQYTEVIVRHMKELQEIGYAGFDMPVFPNSGGDPQADVPRYEKLRKALDAAGLEKVGLTTNVATTPAYNPTSLKSEEREAALAYLKSRVDITAALRGTIMAGPVLFPYNLFPTHNGEPLWSDALQDWLQPRYELAQPLFEQLGEYAADKGVQVAIEPVDHWETPAPNMVRDVLDFLVGVRTPHIGVAVDSSHVVLGSSGPEAYRRDITDADAQHRLHYVQVSPPDRGEVADSWIPWRTFLEPILPVYDGPLLIEVFNAIPAFLNSLRLTRRKFWIPGEDEPVRDVPSAYEVAEEGIKKLQSELATLHTT
ncbi:MULTISPECIES: sugar phosphate isomerase/epimerase family protein [unclassified Streptomyces]|uniref:sugar phosphate isomerase/epimerase family protein n=1 Tax=unclassified Streptomyces TaxID=2593676 RepID=UPI0022B7136C|nr:MULTISPECIES: sugar phosphate isomerase/epimerase family protein [unclassified Streptomyces]MCZ7416837.1 sugar phosphate isomerase/epimerase [Streptomyces sp. WMMC897]MCZ7433344.1 sugar phosphate isomerase/epimerase [Streptomyces sp. WMMC1477]